MKMQKISIFCLKFLFFNPLTPMSDQERISPYNITTESSRQVRRIKKKTQLRNYKLIQYQILQIEMVSISWQEKGRITNEILGVKRLRETHFPSICELCVKHKCPRSITGPFREHKAIYGWFSYLICHFIHVYVHNK